MKFRVIIFFMLLSASLFQACKTDFEINASWKECTIVYGILNQNDTIHYFKINKAFLGDGNAMFMAQNPDSSTYGDKIEAWLYAYNQGGQIDLIPLDTVTVDNKDSGIFYYPKQILYKTTHALNEDLLYKIYIHNKVSGKIITSDSIPLIQGSGFRIEKPFGSVLDFTAVPPHESKLLFRTPKYGKRYQIVFRFHYFETVISTSVTQSKYVDWNLGEKKSSSLSGDESIELSYGEQFFNVLKGAVMPNSLVKRVADKVEIIIYVAGDDLSIYMDVNSPSSSIVQERPEYSNIINGIGIFSSRFDLRKNFSLSTKSLDSLSYGRFTSNIGFVRFP
jgi:hypothetical protein